MRIAIFGGAFDPVHRDHLQMAKACLDFGYSDAVWFLPSPDRWDKRPKASAEHRLAMLRIACMDSDLPLSVRDSEIHSGQYRGTLHMMRRLRTDHPEHAFSLLIGADSIANIPSWRDPLEYDGTNPNGLQLLQEFPLVVYPRKGYAQPQVQDFQAKGYLTPMLFEANESGAIVAEGLSASSMIRPKLWSDPSCRNELPLGVWDYIRTHKLYYT